MFTDAYWPRINGVTVSVDSFARELCAQGHQVLVICASYPEDYNLSSSLDRHDGPVGRRPQDGAPPEPGRPAVVRVPSMPALITKEDRLAKFSKWHWVFKHVEAFGPDIVHINTEFVIAEFGFLYARAHNLPAIYTFHTMWEDYAPNYFPLVPRFIIRFVARGVLRTMMRRSYRVIVPTAQIDAVAHRYRPKTRTFLLPTGIDPAFFEHDAAEGAAFRERLESAHPGLRGRRLLLFAGRVAQEKNIGFLLEVLPAILDRVPQAALLVVGSGPDLEFFQKEARNAGLTGDVVFAGYMTRQDLALTYTIAEVFVFPSLTDTQGLVTLEAMVSGTPVVAIGAMGTLQVMGGDHGGFMVKDDPAEFAARVLDLLENPDLARRKAAEAREHAQAWSLSTVTRKLEGIYRTVIRDYRAEYGEARQPVWERLIDPKWWKANIARARG